jgi:DNA-directed RNA polymerase subunit beta'
LLLGSLQRGYLSEFDGEIGYEAIIEGITYKEESDEQTGHREKVITETRDKTKNPALIVKGKTETKTYNIPVGAHLAVNEGAKLKAGQVLVEDSSYLW